MSTLPSARTPAPRFAWAAPRSLVLTAVACAALAACGGGGDSGATPTPPPTGTVVVRASLGMVLNADVDVTCGPTGTVLGSGNTGSTGQASVTTTGACAGPVQVNVKGRSDGTSTYFDEALGAVVAYPAGTSLRALAPLFSSAMNLGVTALTEVATRQALTAAGSLAALSAAQVTSANAAVVNQVLGTGVTLDILTPPTSWGATPAAGSLGTSDADRYALFLAALAHMGQGASAPALAVLTALAADLADGTLSGNTSGFTYTAASLLSQLSASLGAMAPYASPTLQSNLGLNMTLAAVAPATGAVGDTVTLTGTGFDADPFHMQVRFSNNLAAEVVSSSATSVVVKVPAGAVSGPVTVTNGLTTLSATSASSFTVTASNTGGNGGGGGGAVETWVSRASPNAFLLNGLAYGAGKFVAVGFGKTIITSADGLSWSVATAPDNNYYEGKSVIFTGNQFVMVGDQNFGSNAPPLIATSPDGLTWTRRTWTPAFSDTLVAVATGGGNKITVVGRNGSMASSTDQGLSWTNETTSGVASFTGVAGNDSVRVAVGYNSGSNGVILFNTGSSWQAVSGVSNFFPRSVAWVGSGFMAVGATSADYGSDAVVMSSTDGVTWTRRALSTAEAPAGFKLVAVINVGSTLYATGDDGGSKQLIIKSTDGGATWTPVHQAQTIGNGVLSGLAASPTRVVTVGGVKSVTLP